MVVCSALPSSAKSCLGSISLVWVPLHSNQAQHHLPIKQVKQLSCTSNPALSGFLAQGKGEREPGGDIVKGLQRHHGWPYINQAAIKLSNLFPLWKRRILFNFKKGEDKKLHTTPAFNDSFKVVHACVRRVIDSGGRLLSTREA